MARTLRVSRAAWHDIEDVRAFTLQRFGPKQLARYEALISDALATITEDPERGRLRNELAAGIRSRHISQPGRRASHIFFFRVAPDGAIEVVRFLHEAMDYQRHLVDEDPQTE